MRRLRTLLNEPTKPSRWIEKYGKPYDAPRAHLVKVREELGLKTHAVEDTLRTTGETMIALGLVGTKPK